MVVRGAHDTRPEAGCAEDTRLIEWVIWAGEPGLGITCGAHFAYLHLNNIRHVVAGCAGERRCGWRPGTRICARASMAWRCWCRRRSGVIRITAICSCSAAGAAA